MTDDQLDDLLRDAARSYNAPPPTPRDAMWERISAARDATASAPVMIGRARTPWLRTAAGIAAVLAVGIGIGRTSRSEPAGVSTPTRVAVAPSATAAPVVDPEGPALETEPEDSPAGRAGIAPAGRSPEVERGVRGPSRDVTRRLASRVGPSSALSSAAGSTYGVPRSTPGVVGEGSSMNAYRLAVVEHLARTEVLLVGFRSGTSATTRASREDAEQFGVLTRELLQNTRLLLATRASDDPVLTRLLEDLELVLMQIAQYANEGGARRGDLDAINQSLDRRNVLPKLRSTIPAGAPVPAGT